MNNKVMNNRIKEILNNQIVILDGAMGTSIQKYRLSEEDFRGKEFKHHPALLKGNNDMLSLTQPDIIREIHRQYIEAGADIIETNTFNANGLSQEEYHCSDLIYRLNYTSAQLAKEEAKKAGRPVFVAGSIGPTSKTLSISSDLSRPEFRVTDFDALVLIYMEQIKGLVDGQADILLIETVFDALNAKAALYALSHIQEQNKIEIPVMLSVTINDKSGRTLTGQLLKSLYYSVSHFPLLSFGLNCSFGANDLYPFIKELSGFVSCGLCIYPNAGLPNEMGEYEETLETTAKYLKTIAEERLINIAGGCCGTTPEHIKILKEELAHLAPREIPEKTDQLYVTGLDSVVVDTKQNNFINIGERTNVAGSAKFAGLIREKKYKEASEIARKQIENGASVIDINLDDVLLDSAKEMETFIRYINNDPAISKVPYMIDSSDWNTILAGLKNTQGKCIVNSISLKEGEDCFLNKAGEIRRFGAAVVVMAFDEEGQATTFERKIEICKRAYDLLTTKLSFPPQDIIFDVNILTIGTGIAEHNNYAVDFIQAVRWIKENLPKASTSGGISNLSFSFRGNNTIRKAMHSVFLYHAIKAGLDMGIVNPASLQIYDEIEPKLLKTVENVVLNSSPGATGQLIEVAEIIKDYNVPHKTGKNEQWRLLPVRERFIQALIKGTTEYLPVDINEASTVYENPVEIIEGPLMDGMNKVGELFSEGKMFLPQVVKSSCVMKEAVELLQPGIEQAQNAVEKKQRPVIVIATVKGDVHDIGKNIVGIVLACNNFEIVDLGVMVDNNTIVASARKYNADMIGISGLITPSLSEMEELCRLMQKEQMEIPLMIGGATTSSVHTAVKLAPLYDYGVIHGGNASQAAYLAKRILQNKEYINEIKANQKDIRETYIKKETKLWSYKEAKEKAPVFDKESFFQPESFGKQTILEHQPDIGLLIPFINWNPFFHFWGFKGRYPEIVQSNEEAHNLYETALHVLNEITNNKEFDASLIVRFFNAYADNDDIVLDDRHRLPMLRQQSTKEECRCLADFIPPISLKINSSIGLFCLKVSDRKEYNNHEDFDYLLRNSLCARLTEALAEWIHTNIAQGQNMIRPAFGHSACPDHSMKKDVFKLLEAEKNIQVAITSGYSILPSTSLCGLLIAHPEACYFGITAVGQDQFKDYIHKRGTSEAKGKKLLGKIIY